MTAATKPTTKKGSVDPHEAVRGALSRMNAQLAREECSAALREAWSAVVSALALEPAPELRECPSCGNVGMRLATRCGHCWAVLAPAHDSA